MNNVIVVITPWELKALITQAVEAALSKALANITYPAPHEIINTEQLCERLGVSVNTAIRYRRKGKIPFLILGDSIRYDWNAVIKALEIKTK